MGVGTFDLEMREKARELPLLPGIYQFYDANGKIIYVGKAKQLRKRVLSYFTKKPESGKVRVMVSKVRSIQHVVVDTEQDALFLENSFIKEYQPRYNIQLKDDKSYPWICVKNEHFPRVFMTRNKIDDGSIYYGPYTSVAIVRSIMSTIRSLYKLRTCKLDLSSEKIQSGRYKVCLEYHIENCKGGCEGLQKEEDYNESVEEIKKLLAGNIGSLIGVIKERMYSFAEAYRFEEAQELKEKLRFLETYQSRSVVVSAKYTNIETYSFVEDDRSAYVNVLRVVEGRIVYSYTIELQKKLAESCEELLLSAIVEIRQRTQSDTKTILLPFPLDYDLPDIVVQVPRIGEKKKLLELSHRNALIFKKARQQEQDKKKETVRENRLLKQVKKDLRMNELPKHIECFDNSNIQGANPVASCVVFKNGKPSKRDYRKFHIKTVEGPDDFASMREVVKRRYKRLLEEEGKLPQLIVIDGGKGQLGAGVDALKELGLADKIRIVGIAKRLEELFFPGESLPLYLDKRSETLRLIQHLRNEAHRFAITFHRELRSGGALQTVLTEIQGVGEKTANLLLAEFKSIESIKKKSVAELLPYVGRARATRIVAFFKKIEKE